MRDRPADWSREAGRRARLAFIGSTLSVGGAETLLLTLMRHLVRVGYEPHLLLLKAPGALGDEVIAEGSIRVHSRMRTGAITPAVIGRLYRALRRIQPRGVLVLDHDDAMFAGRIAARLARISRIVTPIHVTLRADGAASISPLNRLMVRFSDRYVATSPSHRHHLIAHGLPAERVHTVMNGVDTQRFQPAPWDDTLRAALGLSGNGPVVGMVALFRPEKNHALAIAAFRLIRNQVPNARLLLIGDGPQRPAVEAHVRELGLQAVVHFAGVRRDVERILPLVDVVMLTSLPRVETLSVALLEAMACARPVVATDVGSLGDLLNDGVNGRLVARGCAAAIAAAVTEILRNDALARRFGQAARATVEEQFSLQQMVAGYEALLTG